MFSSDVTGGPKDHRLFAIGDPNARRALSSVGGERAKKKEEAGDSRASKMDRREKFTLEKENGILD